MQNATRRRKTSENVSGVLEIPETLVIYQSQRKEYKRLLQKKKREEQNSRVDSLLDTMNNSKEFWGKIRNIDTEH